jgi:hypothetical protein
VPLVVPFAVICAAVVRSGARAATAVASGWVAFVGCVVFIGSVAMVTAGIDDWTFTEGRKLVESRISEKLYDQEQDNAETKKLDRPAAEALVRDRMAALDWSAIRRGALIVGIVGLVLAAIGLTSLTVGALEVGIAWIATAVAVTVGLALGHLLPPFDVFISRKPIVLAAVEAAGPTAPIACLRHLDEAFPYYAGRPVAELFGSEPPKDDAERAKFRDAASTFLAQKDAVLVVRRDDFEELHLGELAKGGVKGPFRSSPSSFRSSTKSRTSGRSSRSSCRTSARSRRATRSSW